MPKYSPLRTLLLVFVAMWMIAVSYAQDNAQEGDFPSEEKIMDGFYYDKLRHMLFIDYFPVPSWLETLEIQDKKFYFSAPYASLYHSSGWFEAPSNRPVIQNPLTKSTENNEDTAKKETFSLTSLQKQRGWIFTQNIPNNLPSYWFHSEKRSLFASIYGLQSLDTFIQQNWDYFPRLDNQTRSYILEDTFYKITFPPEIQDDSLIYADLPKNFIIAYKKREKSPKNGISYLILYHTDKRGEAELSSSSGQDIKISFSFHPENSPKKEYHYYIQKILQVENR